VPPLPKILSPLLLLLPELAKDAKETVLLLCANEPNEEEEVFIPKAPEVFPPEADGVLKNEVLPGVEPIIDVVPKPICVDEPKTGVSEGLLLENALNPEFITEPPILVV